MAKIFGWPFDFRLLTVSDIITVIIDRRVYKMVERLV